MSEIYNSENFTKHHLNFWELKQHWKYPFTWHSSSTGARELQQLHWELRYVKVFCCEQGISYSLSSFIFLKSVNKTAHIFLKQPCYLKSSLLNLKLYKLIDVKSFLSQPASLILHFYNTWLLLPFPLKTVQVFSVALDQIFAKRPDLTLRKMNPDLH